MSGETWVTIPGYPCYDASNQGRIRSRRKFRGSSAPHILKLDTNIQTGYAQVHLIDALDRKRTQAVHVLIMLAFVGPRPDGQHIRHIDGNCQNNTLGNLQYGTVSENQYDQVRHGTHAMAKRSHCKYGHEFNAQNSVIAQRQGKTFRECLICKRARGLRTYYRRTGRSDAEAAPALIAAYPHLAGVIETRELRAA